MIVVGGENLIDYVQVSEGDDLPVSLRDGVQALAMAEAAQRSFDSSRPVRLADV